MKQRHQLLSQARIYLTQNPEDANLTTEELRQMVGQMTANHLMNRLQRYVAKLQGTKQYWYQRYQELKALITQKGAPTFFFTFSAADNYWPDLHRLLQEPNNAVPSVRIRAVIDNPHITDAFFVSRLDEFCSHWLDRVMDAKWKWLRFEWQARGSIHAHGCAKLSNDPGLCSLVKTAAQGWKLEQILRCHEQHPSIHQLSNDFQPQIEAGHQAKETVKAYANWLVTTINDALPPDNWTIPSPHPSAISIDNVDNLDRDYEALVNSVERHIKCSTAYCIKIKPGQQPTCRFNFPKDCQDKTTIDSQLITKAGSDNRELTVEEITQAQVKATLTTKRNDGHINSHNRVMLQHWRANVDLQAFVDTDQCIRYMAKYATKGEPRSQSASEILTACVNRLNNTDIASSVLRRAMIQVAGERDIGSQETAHMLLGKPLYSCTYSFLCVSLDGSRRVRTGDEDDENQGDQALDPSVLDHYATRANWQEKNPEIFNLNLLQFASAYFVTKGELKQRKQEVIIRTFPIFSPNPLGKNYGNYCKYALIKCKPWSRDIKTAWDGLDDCHENHIQCYRAFLSSGSAAHYVPMLQQELEQAHRYNGHDHEDDNSDDDDEDVPQREGEPEEWMLLCRFNQHYDDTVSQGSQPHENSQFDWTETARAMPPALLRESANWITKRGNEALEDPSVLNRRQQQTVDPARLNRQQMLAYNILASHHAALNNATPPQNHYKSSLQGQRDQVSHILLMQSKPF